MIQAPGLLTSNILGLKGLSGTNILAHRASLKVSETKILANANSVFFLLTNGPNKLECLSLTSISSLVFCNTLAYWINL